MNPASRHAITSIALAMTLVGCEPGTGGKPIVFFLSLSSLAAEAPPTTTADMPAAPGPGRFTTQTGWTVVLDEACLALGPIYFFAAPSHLEQARAATPPENSVRMPAPGSAWARLSSFVLSVAHAHPGDSHFAGGEVRGEWLSQVVFDALAPVPRALGPQNGLRGPVRSFSLLLTPPRGALAADPCLRGHHAWVSGTATKHAQVLSFEGGLLIDNIGTNQRVDGLPIVADLDDGAHLRVAVRPAAWLDLAEFDTLTETGPSGRLLITRESQVHRAWFIGIRSARAFFARRE